MEALYQSIGHTVSCPGGRGKLIQVMGGRAIIDLPGRPGKHKKEAAAFSCLLAEVQPVPPGEEHSGDEPEDDDPRLEAGVEETRRIMAGEPSVWERRLPKGESGPCELCGDLVVRRITLIGSVLACRPQMVSVKPGGKAGTQYLLESGIVMSATPDLDDGTIKAWELHQCE